jgi:hypothetical protein
MTNEKVRDAASLPRVMTVDEVLGLLLRVGATTHEQHAILLRWSAEIEAECVAKGAAADAAAEARGYARAVEDAARWLDSYGGRAYYESDWTLGKVLRSKLRAGGKTNG